MNLANQVSIPAPAAAAKQTPPIGNRKTAPIANRQDPGDVRPQCDRETRGYLVKRPGSLCLSREAGIAFVAVHDGARDTPGGRSKVHEVQPVVVAESHIGHQKVKEREEDPSARGFELSVTLHVRERRRGRVEDGARRCGRLNQEDAYA